MRRALSAFACLLLSPLIAIAQQSQGADSEPSADAAQAPIESRSVSELVDELSKLIEVDNFGADVDPCEHMLRFVAFRNHQLAQQREALESLLMPEGARDPRMIAAARAAIQQTEEKLAEASLRARDCGPQ